MAVIAGVAGSIKNGANTCANLNSWTVSAKGATAKTTVFGTSGQYETELATVKSWTAKADGFLDSSDTNGQLAFINGLNSTFTVHFLTGDSTHEWNGTAILTGIDPKVDATGVNMVSMSFNGTGVLNFV